jgi:signal transduction histidine kinase
MWVNLGVEYRFFDPGRIQHVDDQAEIATGDDDSGSAVAGRQLHFDVSTGLKRVIGRDLITDDEVAIFELVKNSFDAGASIVQLRFEGDSIWLVDNGDGMTLDDLTRKWLFVAYSSKRDSAPDTFRQQIAERRHFAGSKGIGRFSSDRLGRDLVMQTRPRADAAGTVHQVEVNWQAFEADETKHFGTIPVDYAALATFDLPADLDSPAHGTALQIRHARVEWDRSRILHLKASLAKLINPFGAATDGFRIEIIAPAARARDDEARALAARRGDEPIQNEIVNGEVGNFIFATLREKTTFIDVSFSADGADVITTLTDRGEVVFRIREPNPFDPLKASGFTCQLFYLNQSAKTTFARRMGIPSVRFGSVFLFRNGFRVYPIGDDGDDWFGIDARKQQGYARFLGTRDVIGRIEVSGTEEEFKEASSRNQGLIDTEAVRALRECFWEFCLKRLERYVVPVSWADKGEKLADDLSRLMTDSGRARVAAAVARLIDAPEIELLDYSRKLIGVLNERSNQFEDSLSSLRAIADKTHDANLHTSLERAERRFEELKSAEAEALRIAEEERKAKEAAQAQAEAARVEVVRVTEDLEEERKRSLFLTSITSLDAQNIINMHHQITIYAADLKQQIENCLAAARADELSMGDLVARLEQVAFLNQKVLSISRLATKANFRLESDTIEADLANYIEDYIVDGATPFLGGGIELHVDNSGAGFVRRFRPMEVAIVIDNLINNARKAKATELRFRLAKSDKSTLLMEVCDDGAGLPTDLEEPERIFELGFSRSAGSGLGLYHVRQVLGEMGGGISVMPSEKGACFLVRITG